MPLFGDSLKARVAPPVIIAPHVWPRLDILYSAVTSLHHLLGHLCPLTSPLAAHISVFAGVGRAVTASSGLIHMIQQHRAFIYSCLLNWAAPVHGASTCILNRGGNSRILHMPLATPFLSPPLPQDLFCSSPSLSLPCLHFR